MIIVVEPHVDVAVVGAGPYGLSVCAHTGRRGLKTRIFGETMQTWVSHMPRGMYLKSTPAASDLSAGRPGFGLADYCRTAGVPAPTGDDPVPLDLFIAYGRWFADHLESPVEPRRVARVDLADGGFEIETDDGERFGARSVVAAGGLMEHAYVPPELASLANGAARGEKLVTHSSQHTDLGSFSGQDVAVVGAGQSALETAVLLADAGARPTVVARRDPLRFAQKPSAVRTGSLVSRKPDSPMGPGWSLLACARGPELFRRLPHAVRFELVARILGPAGAWWLQDRFTDRFPVRTGHRLVRAESEGNRAALHTISPDGRAVTVRADHIISATGYRIGRDAFGFLSPALRRHVARSQGWPQLRASFQSSVPGLYFVGFPAAGTYGPLMRFVCGTAYAAPRLTAALAARTADT
jgi:cation diffusion facilitator CzcD-associated flavoprotein CzcO